MSCQRASNTNKAYRHAWKGFTTWCTEYGRTPLPASESTVLDFIAWCLDHKKYRLGTIQLSMAAIRFYHREAGYQVPTGDHVQELLRNAPRKLKERPGGKKALTPKQLRRICMALESGDRPAIAVRDQAMILLAFAAGWRRSEVSSLDLGDVSFDDDRVTLQLGASKGDQAGKDGRMVILPLGSMPATCPVRVLREWIRVRGSWQGPLFCRFGCHGQLQRKRVSGLTLNLQVKKALAVIGENPAQYGAHSLRSGMVTASGESGADIIQIMQRTGHKRVETVLKYVRPAKAFAADPLAGVL